MKKLLGSAALVLLSLVGQANAALVSLSVPYIVEFADGSVVPAIQLPAGSIFNFTATFDDTAIDVTNPAYDFVVIPSGGPGTFNLGFGPNYSFTAADDNFGGPELQLVKGTTDFSAALFETLFTIGSGSGAGDYLLSFYGDRFQVTPSGNTVDFKMTGMAVPEPSSYLLVLAGFGGLMATIARRRKAA